jgi:hypothetical protein
MYRSSPSACRPGSPSFDVRGTGSYGW